MNANGTATIANLFMLCVKKKSRFTKLLTVDSFQNTTPFDFCQRIKMKIFGLFLCMILSVDGCEIGWLDGGGRFCYHFGTTAMTFGAAQEVKN